MPKVVTIQELPEFIISIVGDSTGPKTVTCIIQHGGGGEGHEIDVVAASQAAVSALSGQGITLTAAQVRTVWRQLLAQSLAQAKTQGGWT